MSFSLETFDQHGTRIVGTLTKSEWEAARAEADLVHVVQPERSEGGWE